MFNISGKMHGVQIAGLFNIADEAHGLVIAPVNVLSTFDGVPVGLLNLIGDGIHDLSVWYSSDQRTWVGLLNGSKTYYSIGFVGVDKLATLDELSSLALGLGLGFRIHFTSFLYADFEADLKTGTTGSSADARLASLVAPQAKLVPAARASAGFDLGFLKLFGGINADLFPTGLMAATDYLPRGSADPNLRVVNSYFAYCYSFTGGVSISF